MGVAPTSLNYSRLERIAEENSLSLPPRANNGKPGPRPQLRTSPIWNEERLRNAVVNARSLREVAANLGLDRSAVPRLQKAAAEFGISLPRSHGGADPAKVRAAAIERTFRKGTRRVNGDRLKRYIITLGVMPYLCGSCGQSPRWNGKPLVLQVDHINGDCTDNRLENLRLLCPNCHSQTETFADRNCGRGTMGNSVTGSTPGFDIGEGHIHPGSNPGSPATSLAA